MTFLVVTWSEKDLEFFDKKIFYCSFKDPC